MTDPTPPHRRSPMKHERDACPYCAEDVLTVAWLAGAESKHDEMQARIEALEAERDKMREALRPFVEYVHDDLRRGNAAYVLMPCSTSGGGWIGAEDLRRARAALKGEGE